MDHQIADPMPEPMPALAAAATLSWTPCGAGRMAWRSWGAGPPLVLLHGGTGSWRHWGRNIAALSRSRRVLAPDLPGLGASDMPPEPYTPASIAAIVGDGVDALLGAQAGYDLAGFSFGALVASQLALRHAARVASLTVVGPNSLGMPRAPVRLEKVRTRSGADRLAANRENLARFMFADPARIDDQAVAVQDWNTVHARLRSKPFAEGGYLRDAVAVASARVTAIYGDADATASPSVAARLDVLRAARPDIALHVVAAAGHWAMWEQPAAVDALLLDALR